MSGASADALLVYLDAKVKADGAPAGFAGLVTVGIRGPTRTLWWQAECFPYSKTRTVRSDAPPEGFDVAVGVDADTAAWAIGAGDHPGPLKLITGDRRLWSRFLDRYLRATGMVGARLWQAGRE